MERVADLAHGALAQNPDAEVADLVVRLRLGNLDDRRVEQRMASQQSSLGKPDRQPPRQAQSQAAAQASDLAFQIEVSTTVVPGSSRLVEIANFMAALAQDPAVAPRFQLKTWEVRPSRDQSAEQLNISIALVGKRP